jgi:UDP-N-acetylmuramoylalanine-D-glutamate ligase
VADRLADALKTSMPTLHKCPLFEDAVRKAAEMAMQMPGANVLLSPGFSSFDQFSSYEARGKSFSSTVLSLKNRHECD